MYIEILQSYMTEYRYISPQTPATKNQIEEAEQAMKIDFPEELKELLGEFNGDKYLLLSCEQIVKNNLLVREGLSDVYDGLYDLLFIAENGCGDYYGYKIQSGACVEGKIIIWEHETNETHVVANSIKDMIIRYYSDEI